MTNEFKAKHTPGPWNYDTRKERLIGSNGVSVSVWNSGLSFGQRSEETEANAILVKAAPELLDALKHALGDVKARLYVMPADVADIERAILNAQIVRYESAIMKAEGR